MATIWQRARALTGFPAPSAVRGRALIISEGGNASVDYFVRPYLRELECRIFEEDSRFPPDVVAGNFDVAVVVRYLPAAWHNLLTRMRRNGKPVIYFMDDDLMDAGAHAGLPKDYQRKIEKLAFSQRQRIEKLCSEFWVSTPKLAAKYAVWRPRLLLPHAVEPYPEPCVTVCYHGTSSHVAEQRWLLTVIGKLQAACDNTHFSIVGNAMLNKEFRELPRVSVVHPMTWQNYLAYTSANRCDIALAPLVPDAFNAFRGPTKFLDFARMGAVGLFADASPYREIVRHDVDGLLLPMRPGVWVKTIRALAEDPQRRAQLVAAARARAAAGPLT